MIKKSYNDKMVLITLKLQTKMSGLKNATNTFQILVPDQCKIWIIPDSYKKI